MTAAKAYDKICEHFSSDPDPEILGIREYDNMFGFFLAPKGTKKGEDVFVGSMVCVMKDSGKVEFASDMEDQSFYRKPWVDVEVNFD